MKIKLLRDQFTKVKEHSQGYSNICAIDEVGRGPIAGPVVSCAIIMPKEVQIKNVKDSKKISDKKRRMLVKEILQEAEAVGIGVVDQDIIDDINIRKATHLSMELAILDLKNKDGKRVIPDLLLIDAELLDNDFDQIAVIGGDDSIFDISCASIVAKVYRDDMMINYDSIYPGYEFKSHKGYGTKKHYQAIDELDLSPIHRKSFMKKYYEQKAINRQDGRRD